MTLECDWAGEETVRKVRRPCAAHFFEFSAEILTPDLQRAMTYTRVAIHIYTFFPQFWPIEVFFDTFS